MKLHWTLPSKCTASVDMLPGARSEQTPDLYHQGARDRFSWKGPPFPRWSHWSNQEEETASLALNYQLTWRLLLVGVTITCTQSDHTPCKPRTGFSGPLRLLCATKQCTVVLKYREMVGTEPPHATSSQLLSSTCLQCAWRVENHTLKIWKIWILIAPWASFGKAEWSLH